MEDFNFCQLLLDETLLLYLFQFSFACKEIFEFLIIQKQMTSELS